MNFEKEVCWNVYFVCIALVIKIEWFYLSVSLRALRCNGRVQLGQSTSPKRVTSLTTNYNDPSPVIIFTIVVVKLIRNHIKLLYYKTEYWLLYCTTTLKTHPLIFITRHISQLGITDTHNPTLKFHMSRPLVFFFFFLFLVLVVPCLSHGGGGDHDDDEAPPAKSTDLKSKSLITVKIACLVIIFVLTFISGVSPYFLKWSQAFLVLGTQFAGGVFLATALMHFLSDADETFTDLLTAEGESEPSPAYPFAYMLACAGYMLTMLADSVIAHVYSKTPSKDVELQGTNLKKDSWFLKSQSRIMLKVCFFFRFQEKRNRIKVQG